MKMNRKIAWTVLSSVVFFLTSEGVPAAGPPLHFYHDYAKVLKTYVDKAGGVDYPGLLANRGLLDKSLQQFSALDAKTFKNWGEKDRIAFYLNAYNARTLQAILDHYPAQSIKDIPGVWDELTFPLLGRQVTLDHIEHELLRKKFHEPRIHMALVCASKGCPLLRNKPYYGFQLDALLEEQSRKFFRDPAKFRIDSASHVVYLSPLFEWYGKDFTKNYASDQWPSLGLQERAVLNFALQHAGRRDRGALTAGKVWKIRYLPYDWSLNQQGK